jgi:membrane protein
MAARERISGWARLTWRLGVRTVRDSVDDRVPGLAAEVAFFALLSIPPLLLVGLGVLGFAADLAGPDVIESIETEILDAAAAVLTDETVADVVEPAVDGFLERGRADVLSIGAILALWSGSRAIRVFVRSVSIAYDLEDRRTWWQHQVLGLALTAAGILVAAVLLPLLILGPRFGAAVGGSVFELVWGVLWFPAVATVGLSLLTWIYHIVPPWRTAWRRDLPGAVLALTVWALGSFGLRVYALTFVDADSVYGVFGTPLVALLWIYVTAIALLLGAELNAEIEREFPSIEPAR